MSIILSKLQRSGASVCPFNPVRIFMPICLFFEELDVIVEAPLQMSGILICRLLRIISPRALLENLDKSVVLQTAANKTSHVSDGN